MNLHLRRGHVEPIVSQPPSYVVNEGSELCSRWLGQVVVQVRKRGLQVLAQNLVPDHATDGCGALLGIHMNTHGSRFQFESTMSAAKATPMTIQMTQTFQRAEIDKGIAML
jgi:hypothetical protein